MSKNVKKIIGTLLLIISIFTFTYSILNIVKWDKDNRETEQVTEQIKNEVTVSDDIVGEENNNEVILINPENEDSDSLYWELVKYNFLNAELSSLKEKNKDTVGWIKVYGTDIDYPFVHTKNNDYYLTHNIEKKYTDAGWIFLDYRNDINDLSANNILYGHARLDKTMFGTLKNTLKKAWFENTANHVVKISTENENSLWQVFSIYHIKTESYYITVNFKDDNDFQEYINKSLSRSIYKFDANVTSDDTILTLSTCYGDDRKLVLQAKLIKKEIKNS